MIGICWYVAAMIAVATVPALRGESSEPRPVCVAIDSWVVLRPFASGCTPTLEIHSNSLLNFAGCPTNLCAGQGCQTDESTSDRTVSCYCRDGDPGVLCKGMVYLDEDWLPIGWTCFAVNCPDGCERIPAPPPPEFGSIKFAVCDC